MSVYRTIDVEAVFLNPLNIEAEIEAPFRNLDADFTLSFNHDTSPTYEGEYVVIPKSYDQNLETKGLRMKDDVTVTEIPYYETTNESGGYTVVIGG